MSFKLKSFGHSAFILLMVVITFSIGRAQSVLSTGSWHKFSVSKNGVYKISFDLLKRTGIDPARINPKNIRIFGNEGGMLPQLNSAARPSDLTELSIYVNGEEDGVFQQGDYILFYAEGPDHVRYDVGRDIFQYESNLYDSRNFYFLTIGDVPGKRIETSADETGSFPAIAEYNDFVFHEVDEHNELKSGREWFGEKFDVSTELSLSWDVTGIVDNSVVKIVSDVMGQSYSTSSFKLYLNNQQVAEQSVLPISTYQYAVKGNHRRDTIAVNATSVSLPSATKLDVKYQFVKATSGRSIGYLDFLLLSFHRKLALYNDQTIFRSTASTQQPVSSFQVSSAASATVWDITNPYTPKLQIAHANNEQLIFATSTAILKEFVVFNGSTPEPEYLSPVQNQNLHGLNTPDLIIVTHPTFLPEAQRLAQHRIQKSGWSVALVTTDEVFNEFSSGRKDVSAIRDFARYLYDKNPNTLKSVLLFGRGSYDYKDRLPGNTNFIPSYESRNSLSPLETYSSDDYFGFMEANEGNWYESIPEYHTMEIGVGRLPVKTLEEAKSVIDKIIAYETNTSFLGSWRKQIVYVADDGDGNLHNTQADQLSTFVESNYPEYDIKKVFLDAYPQILQPAGEISPETNESIVKSLDQGSLIINYTGHGNESLWAHERIFDELTIGTLDNPRYPLFVTATCEFGRQDDPAQISGAELCLLRNNGGAIGLVSTARPVNANTNFELNKAFYNAAFQHENGEPLTLGEIFRRTKNTSISGVANRNFSLMGDPSLQLAMPKLKARITEIKGGDTTDTLKALSRVFVIGEIVNDSNEKVNDFTGVLQAVLFDKETAFTTLGNENNPFAFKQWYNALFRGQASVVNGTFQFEFIVPKNIAYQLGKGKLSLYAYDKTQWLDAGGVETDFVVGKSEADPDDDGASPKIQLFMGDITFIDGGITLPDTKLIARLADDSGINLSNYGIGNIAMAILDGEQTYILNDYYESDVDDFTKGWIQFPLKGLAPGRHSITVKAWDTFNNPGEATIHFIVTDGNDIVIESFGNYPNPFISETTLFFTHNRSGDDLEATVSIFDITGRELKTQQIAISASPYRVELAEITADDSLGKNLKPGLYLARLIVRSLSNGSKSEGVTKLIMTN